MANKQGLESKVFETEGGVVFVDKTSISFSYYDELKRHTTARKFSLEKYKKFGLKGYEGEKFIFKAWEEDGAPQFKFVPVPDADKRYQIYLEKQEKEKAETPPKIPGATPEEQREANVEFYEKRYEPIDWGRGAGMHTENRK